MGKAKRFNSYDNLVQERRDRAKLHGQTRQNLSGIGSTFRASPLSPPIITNKGNLLTAKGDLFSFSTELARLSIGSNNQVLTADSTTTLGLKWAAGGGGVSFPVDPVIKDFGTTSGTLAMKLDASDTGDGHSFKVTMNGNVTLTFDNPPASGTQHEFEMEFVQDATGGRTVTHPASVAETVTIALGASKTTIITYRTNDNGTTYHAIPALRGSISLAGGAFANQALDNLTSVAINTSLISDTDDIDDLGSATKEWKDLYIDGTANIDILSLGGNANFNNNEANNLKGIDFDVGGPTDTTTLPVIWADASGDLIQNVALADSIFWTINGDTKMNLFEGELDIRSTNQHGVDLRLRNEDTTPLDNDRAGRILFTGDDDLGAQLTYGSIEVEMDDVTSTSNQGQFTVRCQSDNALVPIIDFTGSDAIFRFSSGVDVVRANADNRVALGGATQRWTTVYADIYDIQDDQATATPSSSASSIQADTGGMNFGVPDLGDVYDFYFNGVSSLQIKEDGELQFNTSGKKHKIVPTSTSFDIVSELQSDAVELWSGAGRTNANLFVGDGEATFATETDQTGQYNIVIQQRHETPADSRVIGDVTWQAENSGSILTDYVTIEGESSVVTAGSEQGRLRLGVQVNSIVGVVGLELIGVSTALRMGFFAATPVVKQSVASDTLANLYTALRNYGLIV